MLGLFQSLSLSAKVFFLKKMHSTVAILKWFSFSHAYMLKCFRSMSGIGLGWVVLVWKFLCAPILYSTFGANKHKNKVFEKLLWDKHQNNNQNKVCEKLLWGTSRSREVFSSEGTDPNIDSETSVTVIENPVTWIGRKFCHHINMLCLPHYLESLFGIN